MFLKFTNDAQLQMTAPATKNEVCSQPRARHINFVLFTPFCTEKPGDHTLLSGGRILHLKRHQSGLDMPLCFTN
jgi:hypothetical protein